MEIIPIFFYQTLWGLLVISMLGGLVRAMLIPLLTFVKRRNHTTRRATRIPALKIPCYSFYGIFYYLPSNSAMKKMSLPSTAYGEQLLGGLREIFPNEKIIATKLGFQKVFLLVKPDAVEEFVQSNAVVTRSFLDIMRSYFGDVMFTSSGEEYKSRKRIMLPVFHYDTVKNFIPMFNEISRVLVGTIRSRCHEPWMDIVDPIALCSMDILLGTFCGTDLGAEMKSDLHFVKAVTRATNILVKRIMHPIYRYNVFFTMSPFYRHFKEDVNYIRTVASKALQHVKDYGKQKQDEPKETKSKKGILYQAYVEGMMGKLGCDVDNVRDEVISFLFAGQDTTTTAMCWALYLIGLHPTVQRKIHEELDQIFDNDRDRPVTAEDLKVMHYLDCVLKESQRIYPSVPFNPKYVLKDFDLCGYRIKKGDTVAIDVYNLHRNSDVFPNPEAFDPDRFLPQNCVGRSKFAYVPFSVAPRVCMGQRYSDLEQKTVLANVLRNFSLKSLDHRDKICVSNEVVLRSIQPLRVKFTTRLV